MVVLAAGSEENYTEHEIVHIVPVRMNARWRPCTHATQAEHESSKLLVVTETYK